MKIKKTILEVYYFIQQVQNILVVYYIILKAISIRYTLQINKREITKVGIIVILLITRI